MSQLLADVEHFSNRLLIAEDGPAVTQQLAQLLSSVSCADKQVHDANIIATMIASDIRRLLTHNVTDFRRFATYVTVEPLIR
jgi:predicted nucleic acid-binding protein